MPRRWVIGIKEERPGYNIIVLVKKQKITKKIARAKVREN